MEKYGLPYSKGCYVCGYENLTGLKRKFYWNGKNISTEFIGTLENQGFPGTVHGGIISALLDETMGWAPTVKTGLFCMTAELIIRFIRPIPIQKKIIIMGNVESIHKRLYRATGRVVDEEGFEYSTGKGKYSPLDKETTLSVNRVLIYEADTLDIFNK